MGPGSRRDEILGNPAWEAQNPHFGPKRPFWPPLPIQMSLWSHFWGHFQNRKMCHSLPATGYRINAFTQGFSSKMHFKRTLGCESTSPPPHFHRFPSYLQLTQESYPCEIWAVRQVRSERSGLGGHGLGLGLGLGGQGLVYAVWSGPLSVCC